jgi:hypothetical protein
MYECNVGMYECPVVTQTQCIAVISMCKQSSLHQKRSRTSGQVTQSKEVAAAAPAHLGVVSCMAYPAHFEASRVLHALPYCGCAGVPRMG